MKNIQTTEPAVNKTNKSFAYSITVLTLIIIISAGTVLAAENNTNRDNNHIGAQKQDKLENHAEILGLSSDELKTELESGKTLKEIIENSGLTFEEFKAAIEDKITEDLIELVESGEITQEQADKFLQKIQNKDKMKGQRPERNDTNKKFGQRPNMNLEQKAEILGISFEELKAELESGKKFHEIVESLGLDKEEIHNRTMEQIASHLDELVTEGKITQEQADNRLEEMQNRHEKKQEETENRLIHQAEILGISVEELETELQAGKKFQELAEEAGLSKEYIQERIEEQIKIHLDSLVANGEITQEQADDRLEKMQNRHEQMANGEQLMRKFNNKKMHNDHGMMRPNFDNSNNRPLRNNSDNTFPGMGTQMNPSQI